MDGELEIENDPAPGVIRCPASKVKLLEQLLQELIQLTPFELLMLSAELASGTAPKVREAALLKVVKPGPRASESGRMHGPRFN